MWQGYECWQQQASSTWSAEEEGRSWQQDWHEDAKDVQDQPTYEADDDQRASREGQDLHEMLAYVGQGWSGVGQPMGVRDHPLVLGTGTAFKEAQT